MTTYLRDGRAPIPDKESTSKVMSANKAKDTKPEVFLRKALWQEGIRGYRLHPKDLPGRPDIAFGKNKVAVFINGCFWHRCPTCNLPTPRSNTAFWENKFNANINRDIKKVNALKEKGWTPITIWECQIKARLSDSVSQIDQALKESK